MQNEWEVGGAPKVPARSPVGGPVGGRDSPIVSVGKARGVDGASRASGVSGVSGP